MKQGWLSWCILSSGLALGAALGWWLSSASPLPKHAIRRAAGWPTGIVIHHTATPPVLHGQRVDVATIDTMHARRGFHITDRDGTVYHIGYHFLVLQDGTVLRGRPEYLRGAHAKGHPDMLGIAMVGNFHRASNRGHAGPLAPPPAQLAAVEELTCKLMSKYALAPAHVYLHRDLRATACPGDHFPRTAFYQSLRRQMARR